MKHFYHDGDFYIDPSRYSYYRKYFKWKSFYDDEKYGI